ncbi:uncharacterized protein LDX57_003554 [Aspergillus melleus]|uniref:uncharacterized protein n=1 Tax=Aspergillus melleus TaxID=138277 RepID=UPI001E8DEE90|nr:uncharacterized protein LDX57_003554 [Aspergillus melleus]KAH8425810.1 hypothetical protein LDX57_003554 [Aspergillus melleus]
MGQTSRAPLSWRREERESNDLAIRENILNRLNVPGYSHHPLAIRAPPPPASASNQTVKVAASNTTTASKLSPTPTKAHISLVPHWSYEKNSIAVAIVISVVTVIAFTTLVILLVQKIRRSWKRHKSEKKDYAGSRYRVYYLNDSAENGGLEHKFSREPVMFSKDDPTAREYLVEQDGDKITRVYHAGNNDSSRTFDSLGKPQEPQQQQQPPAPPVQIPQETAVSTATTVDPAQPVPEVQPDKPLTVRGRSGSIPKPIVVVPPPLKHASSLKATPVTQPPDPLPERPSFIPKSRSEARRSLIKLATDPGSLFRLPSIKKTTSPIYRP